MSDDLVRLGASIRRRRERYGLDQSDLAELAQVKSRQTVGAVESGKASAASARRIDEALRRFETESGLPVGGEDAEPNLVTFRLTSLGVDVTVQGPVSDLAALEASVARLVAQLRNDGTNGQ